MGPTCSLEVLLSHCKGSRPIRPFEIGKERRVMFYFLGRFWGMKEKSSVDVQELGGVISISCSCIIIFHTSRGTCAAKCRCFYCFDHFGIGRGPLLAPVFVWV